MAKHLTRAAWARRAAYPARFLGRSLTGTESSAELRAIWERYKAIEAKCARMGAMPSGSWARPGTKVAVVNGARFEVGFYHDGGFAGVRPLDWEILPVGA